MKPEDLQLNAHEIPAAGLRLQGELPAEWAASSLVQAYRAAGPARLALDVQPIGDNVLVRGDIRLMVDFDCSRTLQPGRIDLVAPFSELFVPGTKTQLNLAEEDVSSDDLVDEPWVIEGGAIDLEALVREHLVLAQDPYPVAADVERDVAPAGTPLWSSRGDAIDPRWEKLRDIQLTGAAGDAKTTPGDDV